MALDVSSASILEPGENEPMKRRGTPNEPMPRAAARCHRDQLVERLEGLHTSIPNAEEPMAKTAFDHSQQASATGPLPPTDRRRARPARHSTHGPLTPGRHGPHRSQ